MTKEEQSKKSRLTEVEKHRKWSRDWYNRNKNKKVVLDESKFKDMLREVESQDKILLARLEKRRQALARRRERRKKRNI